MSDLIETDFEALSQILPYAHSSSIVYPILLDFKFEQTRPFRIAMLGMARVLRDVHPSWFSCSSMLGPISPVLLDCALKQIDGTGDPIEPPAELILEAFRYCPVEEIHTVILGPGPEPGSADGLCFSSGASNPPPRSLQRIFDCLARAGLRPAGPRADLRPWAAQGVLMLNTSLTTKVGKRGAHAHIWKTFIDNLISQLCCRSNTTIKFLLWGAAAHDYAPRIKLATNAALQEHAILKWGNPYLNEFQACPHFEIVNEDLTALGRHEVNWDNNASVLVFTDGSCPLNGKPDARAGHAAILLGGQFKTTVVRGEVAPYEYAFIDGDDPMRGVKTTSVRVSPTNNRGELLGIIYGMLAAWHGRAVGNVEIISDSSVCIETLTKWLPARLKTKTESALKNSDLVMIAWHVLSRLRQQAAAVGFTHVHSHRPAPPASASSRDRLLHKGNKMADHHAAIPLGVPPTPGLSLTAIGGPSVIGARLSQ